MAREPHPQRGVPDDTAMGPVSLVVADLGRSLGYYTQAIGLRVLERSDPEAVLGAGARPLVHLVATPGARPVPGCTGLFHLALRVPERRDLAAWLAHAVRTGVPLAGAADHVVSEAVYLQDPDGHGIEVYRDRPRARWEGRVGEMTTLGLDVDGLLAELGDPAPGDHGGLPDGTDMGHVHLRVADVPAAVAFYRDVLGFDLMTTLGPHAAFLAAGGYHHHVGVNAWQSRGAPPPPAGSASLRHATIAFPDARSRDAAAGRVADAGAPVSGAPGGVLVRDPSGNALLLAAPGTGPPGGG